MIAELLLPPSPPLHALDSGVLRQGGRHDQPDGLGRMMGVVAHRSKTTAGILPLRFAHPTKIRCSATTPVTDLVH
jgi:hypothetical protein